MAITNCIQVGDRVSITIDAEDRNWGYNPVPDGTLATVIGFNEIAWGRFHNCGLRPGIHQNRAWAKLRLDDGKEMTEWSGRITLLDKSAYEERIKTWQERQHDEPDNSDFIRDLPETPFWEGDWVRDADGEKLIVLNITYADNGKSYYGCSSHLNESWRQFTADKLELVARGNVWKIAHGEPPTFANLEEEATFAKMRGCVRDVRNPADSLYHWSLSEALDALQSEVRHSIIVNSSNLFEFTDVPLHSFNHRSTNVRVITFLDKDLGARVRSATLQAFSEFKHLTVAKRIL